VADGSDDTPYQSLYRRFRPSTFGEVRGQDHIVLALRNAVRDQRVAHAYLFSGPRGTGKTSTARILAKALNCTDLRDGEPCGVCSSCVEIAKGTSLDVHELDAASNNGVEAMRDLVSRAALGTPGRQKVYIVDEVHMLSTPASNALLKTLEEPPAHVIFVLATTDPQKVLPTIRSRTQHFEFRLLGPEVLGELLDQVRREAHLDVPDEGLDLAVRRGRGSARDALSVLDQVAASHSVDDDLPELDEVVEALAERDVGRALVAVAHLASAGFSPQQLAADLVDYLRQGFLAVVAPDLVAVSGTEHNALASQADRVGLAALVRAMEVLGRTQVAMRDAADPRVDLELALVRLAHPEADDSPEALLARIERLEASGGTAPPASVAQAPDSQSPVVAPNPALASARRTVGAVRRQSAPVPAPAPALDPAPTEKAQQDQVLPPGEEPDQAAPATRPSGDFPNRDEFVQAWGDHVIGDLRPKAKALFQAGRFVGVDGHTAIFGLPNEIHRNRCEEVRGEIESVLSAHFGQAVALELVIDNGATPNTEVAASPPLTPDGPPGAPSSRSPSTSGRVEMSEQSEEVEDLAAFDESDMGEVAKVDNSVESRVLQAFPGAEEVG
jgi:DNA polymerase III subunit gamma/tau